MSLPAFSKDEWDQIDEKLPMGIPINLPIDIPTEPTDSKLRMAALCLYKHPKWVTKNHLTHLDLAITKLRDTQEDQIADVLTDLQAIIKNLLP